MKIVSQFKIAESILIVFLFTISCKTTMPINNGLDRAVFPVTTSILAVSRPPVLKDGKIDEDANKQFIANHYHPLLVTVALNQKDAEGNALPPQIIEITEMKNFFVAIDTKTDPKNVDIVKRVAMKSRTFVSAQAATDFAFGIGKASGQTKIEDLLEISLASDDLQVFVSKKIVNPIRMMEFYTRYGVDANKEKNSILLFPSFFAAPNMYNEYSDIEFKVDSDIKAVVFDASANISTDLFSKVTKSSGGYFVIQGFANPEKIEKNLWSQNPFIEVQNTAGIEIAPLGANLFDPSLAFPFNGKYYRANNAYVKHLSEEQVQFSFDLSADGPLGAMSTKDIYETFLKKTNRTSASNSNLAVIDKKATSISDISKIIAARDEMIRILKPLIDSEAYSKFSIINRTSSPSEFILKSDLIIPDEAIKKVDAAIENSLK